MIKFAAAIAFMLTVCAAFSFARKEETLEELIARADAARPDQQPNLYMDVAERQWKASSDAMKGNRSADFRAGLQEIVKYCDKARIAALQSNKHVKNTEIKIRRISGHLKDVKLDAEPDDQPAVQSAIDKLEQFRTELLQKMFGGKSND